MRTACKIAFTATSIIVAVTSAAIATTTCTFTDIGTVRHLDGNCTTDETLVIPDGFILDCHGFQITAEDPPGGPFAGGVLENGGTWAGVRNCWIQGDFTYPGCQGGADRLRGILFDGASGLIEDNLVDEIHRPLSHFGCQEGNSIEVRNEPFDGTGDSPTQVSIDGNVATDYQKNGITANGNIRALITDNTVEGAGQVDGIAQNGIQFGFGASGQMRRNYVDGNWYTGENWAATGLLVFEASGIYVQGNEVRENQVGVSAETWGWFVPDASRNWYLNNEILENVWGVSIGARSCGAGYSNMDAFANGNLVIGNSVVNAAIDGATGISIFADEDCFGGTMSTTATTDGTRVHGNRICGFDEAIGRDGDTNSSVSGNFDCTVGRSPRPLQGEPASITGIDDEALAVDRPSIPETSTVQPAVLPSMP